MNGTDDTEYEDDEQDQDPDAYREDETPEPEYEDMQDGEENLTAQAESTSRAVVMDTPDDTRMSSPLDEDGISVANAAARLNAQLSGSQPPAEGAWHPPPAATYRSFADMLPIVESTRSPPASDVASNRSGGTNRSNGATFFRNYLDSNVPTTRPNGSLTPDLNFAEIGHGRGVQPSGSVIQYHMRRGQEHTPHSRPMLTSRDSSSDYGRVGQRLSNSGMWPYQEPPSPAVASSSMHHQESLPQHVVDGRGRGMKKSIINAAEHLFGRGSGSRHSRDHDDSHGPGPSSTGAGA
jgi:F-box and leucine-rich repeat protein GRR1